MSFLIACLGLVAIGLFDGAIGVAWPAMRTGFGLPQAAFGLLLASISLGVFCAGLVAGRLIQTLRFPTLMLAAGGTAAAGVALQASAPLPVLLCAGALIAGLGAGTLDSSINAVAAMQFGARQVNWMHGCFGIGATLGPLLMTAMIVTAGLSWRTGYAVLALILLAITLVLRVGAARGAPPRPGSPPAASDVGASAGRQARVAGSWRAAARHRLVLLQVVLFFVYTGVEVMLGQWSFTVLTELRGVAPAIAGAWTSAYWISMAAGRFGFGAIVERVGPDRLLRLATLGVLLGTVIFALAPGASGVIGLVLAGGSLAPIFPTLIARAPERLGADIALHAVGFKVSAATFGGAALPALAGVAAQFLGLEAIGWFAVAGAICVVLLHEAVLARSPQHDPGRAIVS